MNASGVSATNLLGMGHITSSSLCLSAEAFQQKKENKLEQKNTNPQAD